MPLSELVEAWKEYNAWCDEKDRSIHQSWAEMERRHEEFFPMHSALKPRTLEAMLTWLANGKE